MTFRKPDGAGKGDAPRPLGVDWDKFSENFDNIFGKKKDEPSKAPQTKDDGRTYVES